MMYIDCCWIIIADKHDVGVNLVTFSFLMLQDLRQLCLSM